MNKLPCDVLYEVFVRFADGGDLGRVCQVNKLWLEASNRDTLWSHYAYNEFNYVGPEPREGWRKFYTENYGPYFSVTEIARHKTLESCWIILGYNVLDLTPFLSEHPGGAELIADFAGSDATKSFEDVGHSRIATKMSQKFIIGRVRNSKPAPSEIQKDIEATDVKQSLLDTGWRKLLRNSVYFYLVFKIGAYAYYNYSQTP